MAISRREKLKNWLLREFSAISEDNGYRTTPLPAIGYIPPAVEGWPQICVVLGNESLTWLDDARTRMDTVCDVLIRGYFSDDTAGIDENIYAADTAGEPLLHDMKQVFATRVTTMLTDPTNPWVFSDEMDPMFVAPVPFSANQGYVEIRFRVRLRVQDSTWE